MAPKQFILSALLGLAYAQFPPKPEGVTLLKSKFHENVTISYKEPGICETTPGVKSYSGYVHLPPGLLNEDTGEVQDYPINTFFWFFEARTDPLNAPLAIWLNGGPGGSSMMGLLEENGPCFVTEDSKSTYLNPYSWNNEVNMLYLDQPAQVGFSYDIATNGSLRLNIDENGEADFEAEAANFTEGHVPASNLTYRVGTFGSQDVTKTANTTAFAAHALWHFAQAWFFEFPYYKPSDDRVSLWAESYGGHYGPGIFRFFQQQNEKIANGNSTEEGAQYIHLDTLGIVNGLLDMAVQGEAYIKFPYNNTYGIQAFNESIYETFLSNWTEPGGCRDQVVQCQEALKERDGVRPRTEGTEWRQVCEKVLEGCSFPAVSTYQRTDHAWYDIGHPNADPFPAPYMYGYFTQESVLSALGVPVNYSEHSGAVGQGFQASFDIIHGGFLEAAGYLLDTGVKVHMMYGDRDYACNWLGGEAASLAIPYSRQSDFADAGYAPLLTEDGVLRGFTRQLGNFSFSRVFQAGHEVPSYQPEAALAIFNRAMFGLDVPEGRGLVTDDFVTAGPKSTFDVKNIPPERPESRCNVLKPSTCTPALLQKVAQGKVIVKDFFVVSVIEDDDENSEVDAAMGTEQQSQTVIGEL